MLGTNCAEKRGRKNVCLLNLIEAMYNIRIHQILGMERRPQESANIYVKGNRKILLKHVPSKGRR